MQCVYPAASSLRTIGSMSVLYPVAATAEAALTAPLGRAAREREAEVVATGEVEFVSEPVGPAFESYDAAWAAFRGRIDTQPEDRFCTLREVLAAGAPGRRAPPKPVRPIYKDGRRWPAPKTTLDTVWRLSISYWRIVDEARFAELEQARKARKAAGAEALDAKTLRALAHQPLRPVRPQQPLDVGLFEFIPPDAPHIVMPDE